jgi:hypothetical protein
MLAITPIITAGGKVIHAMTFGTGGEVWGTLMSWIDSDEAGGGRSNRLPRAGHGKAVGTSSSSSAQRGRANDSSPTVERMRHLFVSKSFHNLLCVNAEIEYSAFCRQVCPPRSGQEAGVYGQLHGRANHPLLRDPHHKPSLSYYGTVINGRPLINGRLPRACRGHAVSPFLSFSSPMSCCGKTATR